MVEHRTCRICGNSYPYNLVYFVKRKKHFRNVCVNCKDELAKQMRTYKREYARSKKAVLKRDRYKCVECGSTENIHVHHKQYRSNEGSNDLDNLVTLCAKCHKKKHIDEVVASMIC